MRCLGRYGLLSAIAVAAALAFSSIQPPRVSADGPVTFACHFDSSCPEVMIAGDPYATLGGGPSPFRGYGDPSLERDPVTGTLWMSYSWLDLRVTSPGPPPVLDFGVRTHLARSDDNGATFNYVGAANVHTAITHPDTGVPGFTQHEVSTLLREPGGGWQLLWLTYFQPSGSDSRSDFYYNRSLAAAPADLGAVTQAWIRGYGTSPSFGAQYNLSTLPQLSDCVTFTEPALFAKDGVTYLATNCVVFDGSGRRDDLERLVLLRQETSGYSFVGTLLTHADAVDLGGSRIEQADISFSKSGAVILVATPIQNTTPNHLGCVAFEISDITTAQVRRDAGGHAGQLARITGEGSGLGPGLCTYDAASTTGVLMVMQSQSTPNELVFSMHATGVHPDVAAPPSVGGVALAPELSPAPGGGGNDGGRWRFVGAATAMVCAAIGFGLVRRRRRSPVP